MARRIEVDEDWSDFRADWLLRSDTTYLNHGSFAPQHRRVHDEQQRWQLALAAQPMDFFVRQFEPAWLEARRSLAQFVDTAEDNLVFVENSTVGMNIVANSFSLQANDEVLLTDHEYGAVIRIWERAARDSDARVTFAELPLAFESEQQVGDAIFAAATDRTKLIVVSHVTSPSAIILPVNEICREASRRGIAVCIDGPHAPAQTPVHLDGLGCDYYTASLHKWVSAPIGSGFLYVAPERQATIETPQLSWGRIDPIQPNVWWDEFVWSGTRDPSALLAVPTALQLLHQVGVDNFRARSHFLARYARRRLGESLHTSAIIPDDSSWYGSMTCLPIPDCDTYALRAQLWREFGFEVPIVQHKDRCSVRVSCHLYNTTADIDRLADTLQQLITS